MTNKALFSTVAGGIFGVFAVALAVGLIFNAQVGSMADWLAAIATVAALGAAIVAAHLAAQAFGLERDRDAERLRAQRTAQAAQVAVWPGRFIPNMSPSHDGLEVPDGITGAVAMLRNASDVPVTTVHVEFSVVLAYADGLGKAVTRYLGDADMGVLPPSTEPLEIRWSTAPDSVMIPGVPTMNAWDDYPQDGPYDPSRLLVDITFRDSAGILWHRDEAGCLSYVMESPQTS